MSIDLDTIADLSEAVGPIAEWASEHWLSLVLTGEIVGAVMAIKVGSYRRGLCWLAAALLTIWLGKQ